MKIEIILILYLKKTSLIFFYAHHFYIFNKTLSQDKRDLCNGCQNTMCFIPEKNLKDQNLGLKCYIVYI